MRAAGSGLMADLHPTPHNTPNVSIYNSWFRSVVYEIKPLAQELHVLCGNTIYNRILLHIYIYIYIQIKYSWIKSVVYEHNIFIYTPGPGVYPTNQTKT